MTGPHPLPTPRQLTVATLAAVVVALVLGVTVVLPAERGVDPTGAGGLLGLTAMGELKQGGTLDGTRTDTLDVVLQAGQGVEVKAEMVAGAELVWSWTSDGGPVTFDFHGEPKGAPPDVFQSYATGSEPQAEGKFVAPFEGIHGWYWKNTNAGPVTIRVTTSGTYSSLSRR